MIQTNENPKLFLTEGIMIDPSVPEKLIYDKIIETGLEFNQFDTPSVYQVGLYTYYDQKGNIEKYLIHPVYLKSWVIKLPDFDGVMTTRSLHGKALSGAESTILSQIASKLNLTYQTLILQEPKSFKEIIFS